MRPVTFTNDDIIEAGKALLTEGRNITGFALRKKIGGGDANRLRIVWDEYQAGQAVVDHEPVAELPVEVAEEMKAVTVALTERIAQLTVELNDKAVRASERRVAEVTRAAGEQTAQAERELADAAQTVDDLEEKLDSLREELRITQTALDESKAKEQSQAIELAQLRERLASTEKQLAENDRAIKSVAEQHRQEKESLQSRIDAAEKKVTEAIAHHTAELQVIRSQHTGEIKELKELHSGVENDLRKRMEETEKTANGELKARQTALDKAQNEAGEAREAKAALTGELMALKSHNEQLAALLAGKSETTTAKTKK